MGVAAVATDDAPGFQLEGTPRVRLPAFHECGIHARRICNPVARLDQTRQQQVIGGIIQIAARPAFVQLGADRVDARGIFGREIHSRIVGVAD
jgi:hypothetical protein